MDAQHAVQVLNLATAMELTKHVRDFNGVGHDAKDARHMSLMRGTHIALLRGQGCCACQPVLEASGRWSCGTSRQGSSGNCKMSCHALNAEK